MYTRLSKLLNKSLKISAYVTGGVILFSSTVAVVGFKSLDALHSKIDKELFKLTGYHYSYDKLQTSFSGRLQPEIAINNLTIYTANKNQPFLKVKKIVALLSYKSLWELQPIFSYLTIDGSNIALEYDQQDNIRLNREIVTNLNSPSKSDFNLDKLLLSQQQIFITNINLSLHDSKHYPRIIHIGNIFIDFNNLKNQHNLVSKLKLGQNTNLDFNASWMGDKIWNLEHWESGNLNLKSVNSNGYLIKLKAAIKNGSLQEFKTKFDSNKQNFAQYDNNIQNFTDFSGAIKIEQTTPGSYTINGQKLIINTKSGYLFKNANLSGFYKEKQGGQLSIDRLGIEGINSILEVYPTTEKLTLGGNSYLAINWLNNISTPESITLTAKIENLSLKSQESNIPSINNVNLAVKATTTTGRVNLNLADSELNSPKELYHPLKINSLTGSIDWLIESGNTKVNWSNISLKTKNFMVSSDGLFNTESTYIDTKARVSNLNLNGIVSDLPKLVPAGAIKQLKTSILKGTLTNGDITLKGNLKNFPFKNESEGTIHASANINNGSYKFLPTWGAIEKVNAKLDLNNSQINLKIISGSAGNTSIAKSTLQVQNWAHSPQLTLNAEANGLTTAYLDYLATTPFANKVAPAKDQAIINGSSKLKVNLKLPLSSPQKVQLSGKFTPENNTASLTSVPVSINNINGAVNFSQKGIEPSTIKATTLNSSLNLRLTDKEIAINSPDLDYGQIMHLAYKPAESVIYGRSATNITYTLASEQLNIKSSLEGVTIDAVNPISKSESAIAPLNISYNRGNSTHQLIRLNYNNQLYTNVDLNSNFEPNKIRLAVGTSNYQLQNQQESAKVTAKIDTDKFSFTDWAAFASKLTPSTQNISNIETGNESKETIKKARNDATIYPIQVEVNTNGFFAKNYNLDGGTLNATVLPESVYANINTPDIKGKIRYQLDDNHLQINLQRLLLSSSNLVNSEESQSKERIVESSITYSQTGTHQESVPNIMLNQITESTNILLAVESTTESLVELQAKKINYPDVDLNIDNFYVENHFFGSVKGSLYEESNSLHIDNLTITNQAANIRIDASDNCLGCVNEYVGIIIHSDINDFGLLLTKLGQENVFSKGKGKFDATIGWAGGFAAFNFESMQGTATLDVNKGQLVQVNPGLFGSLLGVISLSNYATSLNPLGLNSFFGKGFAFDTLKTNLYLRDGTVRIKKFDMVGPIAAVNTFGNLDFMNNRIDTFLTLEPRLGGTVATTAGIVTLNPFIGFFVYAAEYLVGEPINKALAVSFHISGNIESPVMTPTKIDKQIINNFTSSLDILNNIKQPLRQ
ncbi:YhdP family protein [Aquella oligotrophica]|uniref:YhdP central domain-containing protein n=1 Tax=Aquella oligotrophica TaxID=2067065 RepID=A0A2I7N982_9NEIS|nr:DUF3971 domain-containing protein [Aquella oligotrophica]AUR53009.1 hypothetical protein CUN60_12140 [Aquella oligotrophica]